MLEVTGLIDTVNITELSQNRVTIYGNQTIKGKISFISDLVMEGTLEVDGLVNNINISKLAKEALYKSGNQTVSGQFHFNDVDIVGNVELDGYFNGIDLSDDIVTLSGKQEMKGKVFKDDIRIRGNLLVKGLVDNVNLTRFNADCVRLNGLQIIDAKKIFIDNFSIIGNMTIDGFVDGVDVSDLSSSILDRNKNQLINGKYTFQSDVTFQNPSTIQGYLNDVNISEFSRNVVTLSTDQSIEGEKAFSIVTINDDLVLDNLKVSGKVNGKNLSELNEMIVRVSGTQKIYGIKNFASNVTFAKDLAVRGLVNRLRIPQDIVLLSSNQTITGVKVFKEDMLIRGNLNVNEGAKVDGVDVSLLARNAVYLNTTQTILGRVEFKSILKLYDGMTVVGLINDVNLTKDNLMLRNGEQIVTGKKTFQHVYIYGDLKLNGKINGIDLLELNKSSVFTDRHNIITAEKEIIGNLLVKGGCEFSH